MKKYITVLFMFLIMVLSMLNGYSQVGISGPGDAPQTNHPSQDHSFLENTKQTLDTNLNQVLVEMLSGVKSAGGEIYAASKEAIHKSVDFVSEQAPDVVRQFLMWQFAQAVIWASIWVLVGGLFFYFANKLRKMQSTLSKERKKTKEYLYGEVEHMSDYDCAALCKYILSVLGFVIILIGVGTESFEMVKIKVAPKVYLIEYIVDTIKSNTPNHQ